MRQVRGRHVHLAPLIVLALVAAGCGGDTGMGPGGDSTAPSVSISSPSDGDSFIEGADITFQGTAEDDGEAIAGRSMVWESDLDGRIGRGSLFSAGDLSPGDHTVTLIATDPAGNRSTASVSITVKPNDPPSASISSPSDGSTFARGAPIDFRGSGTDPQAGDLSGASLKWSTDEEGPIGAGAQLTLKDLPVATHSVFLVAHDPQGLVDTASVSVTVDPNGLPTVTIHAPSDRSSFPEAESITFEGSGSDPEDGTLTGSSLEWTSDVDGVFGTGETVTTSRLSEGDHDISLIATDSRDAIAEDTIAITIQGDPEATIDQPDGQSVFQQGNSLTLQGSATDPGDGTLTGNSLEWTSDVDGMLGTGETVTTSSLSGGPHTITLLATDSDGNTASDSVDILVESQGFDVRVRFSGSFTESQRQTVRDAMAPWQEIITGDLPPFFPSSQEARGCSTGTEGIDDLLVVVQLARIDGEGGVLAQAGPCLGRTNASGDFTTFISGLVFIDRDDVDNSDLEQIVTHEAGHVLGIGITSSQVQTLWGSNANALGTHDPFFSGSGAVSGFDGVGGDAHLSDGVPLANRGGDGTAGAHWREANLETELMTGFIDAGVDMPISAVTVGALDDIGYTVDRSAADPYGLPMPQLAIWEAEADATLSRPASSDQNFGEPSGVSISNTIVAGANNGAWTGDPDDELFTGLLRLDEASSLPSGVTITDVTLVMQVFDTDSETAGQAIEVVPVTSSWSESLVTWDTGPSFGGSSLRTFPHDSVSIGALNLSSSALDGLVRDWATGATANNGLAFRAPAASSNPTFSVGFASRHDSFLPHRPRIEVTARTGSPVRRGVAGQPGRKIPLGDDIRQGRIYGVGPDGRIVRVVEIR